MFCLSEGEMEEYQTSACTGDEDSGVGHFGNSLQWTKLQDLVEGDCRSDVRMSDVLVIPSSAVKEWRLFIQDSTHETSTGLYEATLHPWYA